jgi:parallel beta-helix repeat protein
MPKRLALAATLVLLLAIMLPISIAKAQPKTIVVPDDYQTITAALGNAINGDTILIRSGTYEGPINSTIVINKTISIIGENPTNTVITLYPAYNSSWILTAEFFTYTDALRISADNCVLMNLKLVIGSPGGYISALGNRALIANDIIVTSPSTGLVINGSNCRITKNVMNGALPDLDGGNIQLFGSNNQLDQNSASYVYVNNGTFNYIKENSCQSLSLLNSTSNIIVGNRIVNNFYGDTGIGLIWSNNNWLYKNEIYGTIAFGLRLWFSSNNTIEANTVSNMKLALASMHFGASYNNLFSLNNFFSNSSVKSYIRDDYSDSNTRGMVANQSTNNWSDNNLGNYWDKYLLNYPNAAEVDSSGVWNIPYVINENNTDAYPLVAIRDISTVQIQLPNWANIDVPEVLSTPIFPASNPSPSPTLTPTPPASPTVPEFSWLTIISLLLSVFAVVVIMRHRKTSNTT